VYGEIKMGAGRLVLLIMLSVLALVDYFGPTVLSFLITVASFIIMIGFVVYILTDMDDKIIVGHSYG
jgi:hypothetical protein